VQPNGVLVLNDRGRADISEISATLFPTRVLYFLTTNLTEDDAHYVQGAAKDVLAIGMDNPTWTAFSITNFTKAAELTQLANDRINGMITGRDPLSALDTYIKDWRSRGGDQIRKEFEDDLKAQ
jgi:putative aldouronate transport system substrate-binding protein